MDEHRRRSLRHLIEMIVDIQRRGQIGPSDARYLRLERKGDSLVLRATNSNAAWRFGVFFVGFSVFWLVGWIRQETGGGGLALWGGVLMGVAFVLFGLFLLLPREVITIFDLRSRRVLHNVSSYKGLYERRPAYSFDEIAGLGVKKSSESSYSYMPVMVLSGGKTRRLAVRGEGYLAMANTIDDVCSATGLAKLNFPTHWPLPSGFQPE
jgi:hypothetical protein